MNVTESSVDVKTTDGIADGALFYPEEHKTWPAVLIWPDILGLRPVFREMGKRLAAQGYVVLIPNLFYRLQKAPVPDEPIDFSKPEGMAKVRQLVDPLTPEKIEQDTTAYLKFLDVQPQTNTKAKAGVQGYCLGGSFSFRSAAAVPNRVGAVASFHGGYLVTDKPDSPHLLFPKIKAHALVAVAEDDDKKGPQVRPALKSAFAVANLPAQVELFEGAKHGWCVQDMPSYNQPAAERAWSKLIALYQSTLV